VWVLMGAFGGLVVSVLLVLVRAAWKRAGDST
jgi:LPS O-antigen subunit length determinant protein (WzzB/FepE family)